MKKRYIALLALPMFVFADNALAAEPTGLEAWAEFGGRLVDENGGSAKLQEYRTLETNIIGELGIGHAWDAYAFELTGRNPGLDDQSFLLTGKKFGQFKYSFYYDDTPHNYTFDALTFYTNPGADTLSYSGAPPANGSETGWSRFDYAIKRTKFGGEFEASLGTPFYFSIGANRLDTEGTKPVILGNFTNRTEVPEPIDHITDNLSLKAGYLCDDYLVEISGLLSSFENWNKYLMWESPTSAGTNYVAGLAPDNDSRKLAAKFVRRNLPLNSSFALSGSYTKMESDYSTTDLNLASDSSNSALLSTLNRTSFDGEKTYTDVLASLSSQLTAALDGKLSYKYLANENDSSVLTYVNSSSTAETNADRLFEYTKNVFGAELGYRLPVQTKLSLGYDYVTMDRDNRPEFEDTTDHIFLAKLKNSTLEFLTAQLQYKHLARDFDNDSGTTVAVADYDAADKRLDEIKLGLEFFAADNFDIGLDYTHSKTEYDPELASGLERGRDEETSNAVYADFLWRLPLKASLNGFAGYEVQDAEALHANGSTPYGQDVESDLWTYGLVGKLPLMDDKLHLEVSWEYQKSDGESNFSIDGSLENIATVADYDKKKFEAKATYAVNPKLGVTLGYLYEQFDYSDLQYEGYDYTASGGSYLSGAYADNNYEANVGYVLFRYGFY